jgi:hypothetical protein
MEALLSGARSSAHPRKGLREAVGAISERSGDSLPRT